MNDITGRIGELQAFRLRLHRLEPSRPLRTARAVVSFIKDRGIVLSTGRSSLPMLAEVMTGRQLRGSWMAQPEVYTIHRLLNQAARSPEVAAVALVLGKETLLDRQLGPAVERIARDPERVATARAHLPPLARRLLENVESAGEIRMDRWNVSLHAGRKARLLLERELLVVSKSMHTESGYHTALVVPWARSGFSRRFSKAARRLGYEEAQDRLLLAAVRSAVIVPEREARRWSPSGADRIDVLVNAGKLQRLMAGRTVWLMVSPRRAARVRTSSRRAPRDR